MTEQEDAGASHALLSRGSFKEAGEGIAQRKIEKKDDVLILW